MMLTRPNNYTINPYTWNRGRQGSTPGLIIRPTGSCLHLTEAEALTLATQIVDLIDQAHQERGNQ